jgi:hypothetical protein
LQGLLLLLLMMMMMMMMMMFGQRTVIGVFHLSVSRYEVLDIVVKKPKEWTMLISLGFLRGTGKFTFKRLLCVTCHQSVQRSFLETRYPEKAWCFNTL